MDVAGVCLDLWGTLIYERSPGALRRARCRHITNSLQHLGVDVSLPALVNAHNKAQGVFESAWARNEQFRFTHAAEIMAGDLGLDPMHLSVIEEGFKIGSLAADVGAVDGAKAAIGRLHEAGIPLALICDVGLTPSSSLRILMAEFGLQRAIRTTVFSDEANVYKPAPAVFELALEGLGRLPPDRCVHIGDRRNTDVAGARSAGMLCIRFTGVYDDENPEVPDADLVASSWGEITRVLGCGAA